MCLHGDGLHIRPRNGPRELIELGEEIIVNGAEIGAERAVRLEERVEVHEDVSKELEDIVNRVVVIGEGGVYHVRGMAQDGMMRPQDMGQTPMGGFGSFRGMPEGR